MITTFDSGRKIRRRAATDLRIGLRLAVRAAKQLRAAGDDSEATRQVVRAIMAAWWWSRQTSR